MVVPGRRGCLRRLRRDLVLLRVSPGLMAPQLARQQQRRPLLGATLQTESLLPLIQGGAVAATTALVGQRLQREVLTQLQTFLGVRPLLLRKGLAGLAGLRLQVLAHLLLG